MFDTRYRYYHSYKRRAQQVERSKFTLMLILMNVFQFCFCASVVLLLRLMSNCR